MGLARKLATKVLGSPGGHPSAKPPVRLGQSPFETDEDARKKRNENAAQMVDPETHGYILLMLQETGGGRGEVKIAGQVSPESWAAYRLTLLKLLEVGQDAFGP